MNVVNRLLNFYSNLTYLDSSSPLNATDDKSHPFKVEKCADNNPGNRWMTSDHLIIVAPR